jgi:sulfatase modifying factor 1
MPKLTRSLLLFWPLWLGCFADADNGSALPDEDSGSSTSGSDGASDPSSAPTTTSATDTSTQDNSSSATEAETGPSTATSTSDFPCAGHDECGDGFCVDGNCSAQPPPNMETIPMGSFPMGCHDADCDADEYPVHDVHLERFAIDRLEVTVGAYQSCVDAGECSAPPGTEPECNWGRSGYGSHPINCVTWSQADGYCRWAGKRLPTEAEWEKASRGTDGRRFSWGDEPADCMRTVMLINGWGCGTGETWPVGSKPLGASPYGLLDMTGNIREWVQDWYGADYFLTSPPESPTGPDMGAERVHRGGSFFGGKQVGLRAGNRESAGPEVTSIAWGFRCADG